MQKLQLPSARFSSLQLASAPQASPAARATSTRPRPARTRLARSILVNFCALTDTLLGSSGRRTSRGRQEHTRESVTSASFCSCKCQMSWPSLESSRAFCVCRRRRVLPRPALLQVRPRPRSERLASLPTSLKKKKKKKKAQRELLLAPPRSQFFLPLGPSSSPSPSSSS